MNVLYHPHIPFAVVPCQCCCKIISTCQVFCMLHQKGKENFIFNSNKKPKKFNRGQRAVQMTESRRLLRFRRQFVGDFCQAIYCVNSQTLIKSGLG